MRERERKREREREIGRERERSCLCECARVRASCVSRVVNEKGPHVERTPPPRGTVLVREGEGRG